MRIALQLGQSSQWPSAFAYRKVKASPAYRWEVLMKYFSIGGQASWVTVRSPKSPSAPLTLAELCAWLQEGLYAVTVTLPGGYHVSPGPTSHFLIIAWTLDLSAPVAQYGGPAWTLDNLLGAMGCAVSSVGIGNPDIRSPWYAGIGNPDIQPWQGMIGNPDIRVGGLGTVYYRRHAPHVVAIAPGVGPSGSDETPEGLWGRVGDLIPPVFQLQIWNGSAGWIGVTGWILVASLCQKIAELKDQYRPLQQGGPAAWGPIVRVMQKEQPQASRPQGQIVQGKVPAGQLSHFNWPGC